tara:strand:- start:486 stop:1898 length:1413 start_codon:yes stop_codon:yes gene_type:complete
MIKFYTTLFELDLTNQKITFVEENNLFYDYFLKGHSLPFSFTLDDELEKKLEFISDYNAAPNTLIYEGKLLNNDDFDDASLEIKSLTGKTLHGIIRYGKSSIPLLETPLSKLLFTKVSVNDIAIHAADVCTQSWPESAYNFPMIIDNKFNRDSNYEDFRGFQNLYENGAFVKNTSYYDTEENEKLPRNYNILTPHIYLIEILKIGFESANLIMKGDLVNDIEFQKIVYNPDNHLEKIGLNDVNQFKDSFNLSDFVPDMTFGGYLTKLKNWLNLDVTYRKNIVTINYIDRNFKDIEFKDARQFETLKRKIIPVGNKVYKLSYSDSNYLHVDRLGLVSSPNVFAKVKEISIGISLLEHTSLDGTTTAEIKEDDDSFRVLLYNGLQSGLNVAVDNVFTRTFSLAEVYDRFWKKWLTFRLNSKTIKSSFKTSKDILSVNDGIHSYNNNQLIKKMTKRKDSKGIYSISKESETLY